MLCVKGLSVGYGQILAVRDINIYVGDNQLVCLLGPNGAGKTTIMRALSGLLKPAQGEVILQGEHIQGTPAEKLARRGIALVPEGREVLSNMSVEENLELGAYVRNDREVKSDLERMYDLFPVLRQKRFEPAGNMSGGEQQMLVIARALMARPKLLLLDEPSLGLAPLLINQIFEILMEIKRQGITIFLVEQNTNKALQVADYAYIIRKGSIVKEGKACDLASDTELIEAYLY